MRNIFTITVLFVVVFGCSTTSPDPAGQQIQQVDLQQNPGFAWYQAEVSTYTPNPGMVDTVKNNFNAADQKIAIFVRPSCGCRGTQRLFPRVMKTLIAANVDMSKVEIWSMRAPSDETPYSGKISLQSLPTIVVMRNGIEVSRVIDADFNDVNADTLIATAVAI